MLMGPVYVAPPVTFPSDVICKFDEVYNDIQRQLSQQYAHAKKLRLNEEIQGGILDQIATIEYVSVTLNEDQVFCPQEVMSERPSRTSRKRSKRARIDQSAADSVDKVMAQRKCDSCGAKKLKNDTVRGDIVCMSCGTILIDHVAKTNEYSRHYTGGGGRHDDGDDDDSGIGIGGGSGGVTAALKRKRKRRSGGGDSDNEDGDVDIEESAQADDDGADDDDMNSTYYKRINHMREVILQVQGKENVTIPDAVMRLILEELHKERIYDYENVTVNKVYAILKKRKVTKYYNHVCKIWIELTGQPGPHIEDEHVEMLYQMFNKIQGPFEKHKGKRKSMIYYHYVCYKIFEMLQLYQYLPLFRFMKGESKIKQADKIWRKVCDETEGAVFIPTSII